MSINLENETRVTCSYGDKEVVVVYPSMLELRKPIADMVASRTAISRSGKAKDRGGELRQKFFDAHATDTSGLRVRQGEAVVELNSMVDGWKKLLPPNIAGGSAQPFDELGTADILETDIIGDPIQVVLDTMQGEVLCEFPAYTDDEFSAALRKFVSQPRVRQQGRGFQFTGHTVGMRFFDRWCRDIKGVHVDFTHEESPRAGSDKPLDWHVLIPANWKVSAVRPFSAQETLTEDDQGN